MGNCQAMIKYHGTPITPQAVLAGMTDCHHCISFHRPDNEAWCLVNSQSIMFDNGAFSAYTTGAVIDWASYYGWLEARLSHPHWAVVPDVIGGTVEQNRALENEWPHAKELSAVVYHLNEPLDRLRECLDNWPKVCLGGSIGSVNPGTEAWVRQIDDCWNVIAKFHGKPWVHMLRAMSEASVGPWPFASADSANFARHHNEYGARKWERLLAMNRKNPKSKLTQQMELLGDLI